MVEIKSQLWDAQELLAFLYGLSIRLNLTQSFILPRCQEIKTQFSFGIPSYPEINKVPRLEILHGPMSTQAQASRIHVAAPYNWSGSSTPADCDVSGNFGDEQLFTKTMHVIINKTTNRAVRK